MRAFEHVDATSVADAIAILQMEPDSAIIAGGTDLLTLMKERVVSPRVLINAKTIDGLDRIEADGANGLVIGALATLSGLAEAEIVQQGFPILAQAVQVAASPQLRNVATVGGSLCQRPRCWYYRGSFDCFLKGGNSCLALGGRNRDASIFGGPECHAVNSADLAPALVALGSSLDLQGKEGLKRIPLESFFTTPRKDHLRQNILGHDEMIVELRVPWQPDVSRGVYLKAMERKAWSFAQASVAIQLSQVDAKVAEVAIILGGVAPTPWRARAAEDVLRGKAPTAKLTGLASDAAAEGARPLHDNSYKVKLVKELVRRGLSAVLATFAARS